MSNITTLQESLLATYAAVGFQVYGQGNESVSELDPVVAYAMLVLQLAEAIDRLKDIKDIRSQAKKDKQKQLFLKILTIVFMVIPFVGEALGPLVGSATTFARIALMFAEAGNAAITVVGIIEDPASAPFAILGLNAGVGGGTSKLSKAEALADASKARGLMKGTDLAKFPQRFRDKDALLQRITKRSCSK